MSISRELAKRSEDKCELCASTDQLQTLAVGPSDSEKTDHQVATCSTCHEQLSKPDTADHNHWRCLNDSMWSQVPAVQVAAYRMLHYLKPQTDWAGDLLDMMYLDDDTREWAMAGIEDASDKVVHVDSNGHVLSSGDSVVLIQDLNVKGSSLTAKRGTAVRRIRLDPDNAEYIEGKVDGQHIVILTKYVKKSN